MSVDRVDQGTVSLEVNQFVVLLYQVSSVSQTELKRDLQILRGVDYGANRRQIGDLRRVMSAVVQNRIFICSTVPYMLGLHHVNFVVSTS
jgi:hypothetical protein